MKILEKAEEQVLAYFWQIVGPLFVLSAFALDPERLSLFCLGVVGLLLSARLQLRGFVYSLILLGLASCLEHMAIRGPHLFLLGIEISYALAFLVIALSAEEHGTFLDSLFSQIDARETSIAHAEEEMSKLQESLASERMAHQEKVSSLQKEIEEMQSEHSSILVLNEVLRQTYARESLEKAATRQELENLQRQWKRLEEGLTRLQQADALVAENRELLEQIHAVRAERAQTRMMNETLAALYAKEQEKVSALEQLPPVMVNQEELAHLQEKIKALSQVDVLYRQLRMQFEEKNQILHETRAKLFHAETELQALQIEMSRKEMSAIEIPKEVFLEIADLEERLSNAETENEELQALVTSLLPVPVKKK